MKYLFTPPGMLMVGANAGIVGMTKEHLGLALALSVPVFVVVTKIDMCPPNVLQVNITFNYTKREIFQKSLECLSNCTCSNTSKSYSTSNL